MSTKFTISMVGFYRLGSRIGTLSRQGSSYIFTSLEPDGKIYAEIVNELPIFAGYTWRDISLTREYIVSDEEFNNELEEATNFVEEYLQEWDTSTPPVSWVSFSPRYDEYEIAWERADLLDIVKIIKRNDYKFLGKVEYLHSLLNRAESITKTLTIEEVRGTIRKVSDWQQVLMDILFASVAKSILTKNL